MCACDVCVYVTGKMDNNKRGDDMWKITDNLNGIVREHKLLLLNQLSSRPMSKHQQSIVENTYQKSIHTMIKRERCVFCGRDFTMIEELGKLSCLGPNYSKDWRQDLRIGDVGKYFSRYDVVDEADARMHFPLALVADRSYYNYYTDMLVDTREIKMNFVLFWYFSHKFPSLGNIWNRITRMVLFVADDNRRRDVYQLQRIISSIDEGDLMLPLGENLNTSILSMTVPLRTPYREITIESKLDPLLFQEYAEEVKDDDWNVVDFLPIDLSRSYLAYDIGPRR